MEKTGPNPAEYKSSWFSYQGAAYTMACLMEGKWAIAEYLKLVDPVVKPSLSKVAGSYGELHGLLEKGSQLFPMDPGEMEKEKCEKLAGLLGDSKKVEEKALEALGKVLDNL